MLLSEELEVAQRAGHRLRRQARHVGDAANRLEPGQHVCVRGGGKERVGVEEVRAAEEVEQHRPRVGDVLRRPGADVGKLALVETLPGLIEELGVLLPARNSATSGKSGELAPTGMPARNRAVSVRACWSACLGWMARAQCERGEEGGGNDQSAHLAHCRLLEWTGHPGINAVAPVTAICYSKKF